MTQDISFIIAIVIAGLTIWKWLRTQEKSIKDRVDKEEKRNE